MSRNAERQGRKRHSGVVAIYGMVVTTSGTSGGCTCDLESIASGVYGIDSADEAAASSQELRDGVGEASVCHVGA